MGMHPMPQQSKQTPCVTIEIHWAYCVHLRKPQLLMLLVSHHFRDGDRLSLSLSGQTIQCLAEGHFSLRASTVRALKGNRAVWHKPKRSLPQRIQARRFRKGNKLSSQGKSRNFPLILDHRR